MGELLQRTAAYYASYLWSSDEARKAREYLLGRGLSEEVLKDFEVGYLHDDQGATVIDPDE